MESLFDEFLLGKSDPVKSCSELENADRIGAVQQSSWCTYLVWKGVYVHVRNICVAKSSAVTD